MTAVLWILATIWVAAMAVAIVGLRVLRDDNRYLLEANETLYDSYSAVEERLHEARCENEALRGVQDPILPWLPEDSSWPI